MKKATTAVLGLLVCFTITLGGTAGAQEKAKDQTEEYERIIKLSNEIKDYERMVFGMNPGRFATQPPSGQPIAYCVFVAQEKLRVVSSYAKANDMSPYICKYDPDYLATFDTYTRKVDLAGTEEISERFLERDPIDRLIAIFHEDFHSNSGMPFSMMGIEESFATAYAFVALKEMARSHFRDGQLEKDTERALEKYLREAHAFTACYNALSKLYNSNKSSEDKLRLREKIFRGCEKKLDEPVNNAMLAFRLTYYFNFRREYSLINRYGAKPSLTCYATTWPLGKEKLWFAEFENCLKISTKR